MTRLRPKASQTQRRFDFDKFLRRIVHGKTACEYERNQTIFSQGDACKAVCYLEQGKVKVSVVSSHGKEAVLALVGKGHFFGEDCLIGRSIHMSTATALTGSRVIAFERNAMLRLLRKDHGFSHHFTTYLLARTVRIEEDLLDHLFNTSERRLARILLLLANFGQEGKTALIVPKITQETLAAMVGTTRPRINSFMRKFQRLGFLDYHGELRVHSALGTILGD